MAMSKKSRSKKSKVKTDESTSLPLLNEKPAPSAAQLKTDASNLEVGDVTRQGSREFFAMLLKNPIIKKKLPSDFQLEEEAVHLESLYQRIPRIREYTFLRFVHAGGSAMVFQVNPNGKNHALAMKIVRSRLCEYSASNDNVARSLSPISETELQALKDIRHPNVVYLHDTISEKSLVVAICTSYVEPATQIDDFMLLGLSRPGSQTGLQSFSPERLDRACEFLVQRLSEIASALAHMHGLKGGHGIYHFDIKPANILISKASETCPTYHAVLTDMGSCIHGDRVKSNSRTRVHFTWPYAHPALREAIESVRSFTGALKVSVDVDSRKGLARYDLYAFGKTMQQLLAILRNDFGERCHASYGFRFLHIIACMLLDGHNVLGSDSTVIHDGLSFVNDLALGYPQELWAKHKINSAIELSSRLGRFSRGYSWNNVAPELDTWQPQKVNCVAHAPAPFTDRVADVMNHPCTRRLKSELQLGWVREVFPGASHDRWSHCLGAFSALVGYYNSLLSDPEVPTFRIFVDKDDLSHAFVAALIHDLAQTTFGHDFEEACPDLFEHEKFTQKLLQDKRWGNPTLQKVIELKWKGVATERVLKILNMTRQANASRADNKGSLFRYAIDGVAADAINGPIDADKADYLLRDSIACGVPYGRGIDMRRFLQALTVASSRDGKRWSLAYKAKGRPAVASLLLARYQMYGAVYWHHTFRCIQAMFVHAAASTFKNVAKDGIHIGSLQLSRENVVKLFYERVICRATWQRCTRVLEESGINKIRTRTWEDPPQAVGIEPALDFVWQFSTVGIRRLIEQLAERRLYKRLFELPFGHLREHEYTETKAELQGPKRIAKAKALQDMLLDGVSGAMTTFESQITGITDSARTLLAKLKKEQEPLIVLDFPVRGIPNERNIPRELEDSVRKYFTLTIRQDIGEGNIFSTARALQRAIATVRVFAEPRLHELIIRYLAPEEIERYVLQTIPSLCQTE